jgi:microcystin-dependent protein
MFAGNFAPAGWALCDGSLLAIADNDVLFNLIGTTYGGDGQSTFALPNLSSRVPLHAGTGAGRTYVLSQAAGVETVTLTTSQIPAHSHAALASAGAANANTPAGNVPANWTGSQFSDQAANTALNPAVVGITGGNQPHENMPPFLAINFIISLFGIFPSQT